MTRSLLLLDVTAMSADALCIAGMDLKSGDTIRLADPQPTQRLVTLRGGVEPGAGIRVTCKPISKCERPHVEDHEWDPRSLKPDPRTPSGDAAQRLKDLSFSSVIGAFGAPRPVLAGSNGAWPVGHGDRSLATVRVGEVMLNVNRGGRLRVSFEDESGGIWRDVPYQDTYARAHIASCPDCANKLRTPQRVNVDERMIRIGLTRPFAPEESDRFCWLQVTNVFNRTREHLVTT